MSTQKTLLVIGGCGYLGRALIKNFKNGWNIANIGLNQNTDANMNIVLPNDKTASQYIKDVKLSLQSFSPKFDAIICTAGGWSGGSIKDSSVFETYHKMHNVNVIPSILAAHLSTQFLNRNGLLVLTGAGGIINNPCHDMIGYGLSKIAVHSLASTMRKSLFGLNEIQKQKMNDLLIEIWSEFGTIFQSSENAYFILFNKQKGCFKGYARRINCSHNSPVIDTPQNRLSMPDADFTTWAKAEQISGLIRMWADGNNLPKTGSFALLNVQNECVVPELI